MSSLRRACHPHIRALSASLCQSEQLSHSLCLPPEVREARAEALLPLKVRETIERAVDKLAAETPDAHLHGEDGIDYVHRVALELSNEHGTRQQYVAYCNATLDRLNAWSTRLEGQEVPLTASFCCDSAVVHAIGAKYPLANEAWDMSPACVVGVAFETFDDELELLVAVQHVGVNLEAGADFCTIRLNGLPLPLAARLLGLASAALLYQACRGDIVRGSVRGMAVMCRQVIGEHLSGMWDACVDGLDKGDRPARVVSQQNVFVNWLPFTDAEAELLAFGTRVSVDALPAFQMAVRLNHLRDRNFTAPSPAEDALSLM